MNRSDAFLLHVDERPPLTVMRYLVTWREDDGTSDWSQYDHLRDAQFKARDLSENCGGIVGTIHDLDAEVAAANAPTPREVVAGYLAAVIRLDAQVQEARGKGRNHAANAYAQEAEDYFEDATGVARQSEDPVALAMVEVADVRRQSIAYGVSPSSQAVRLADLLAKLIEVAP